MSQSPKRSTGKPYTSVFRDRQVAQTREFILDAVTTLLGDRRADEVTTRDIAGAAGVSERTVYRHFPDRDALLEGLSQRLPHLDGFKPSFGAGGLDDLAPTSRRLMELLDEHYVTARAEAVFNADPRRFAADTRDNTREMRELLANELPELAEREQLRIAAVIRCLVVDAGVAADAGGVRGARHRVGPGGGVGDRHHHPRATRAMAPKPIDQDDSAIAYKK